MSLPKGVFFPISLLILGENVRELEVAVIRRVIRPMNSETDFYQIHSVTTCFILVVVFGFFPPRLRRILKQATPKVLGLFDSRITKPR